VRALMWDRATDAEGYFSRISSLGLQVDEAFTHWLVSHLLAYQSEYGTKAALKLLKRIASSFEKLGMSDAYRKLRGAFFAARAFEKYQMNTFSEVRSSVVRAVMDDPSFLTNRGLISMFLRSTPLLRRFMP
jgi:hypothetical protein